MIEICRIARESAVLGAMDVVGRDERVARFQRMDKKIGIVHVLPQ